MYLQLLDELPLVIMAIILATYDHYMYNLQYAPAVVIQPKRKI